MKLIIIIFLLYLTSCSKESKVKSIKITNSEVKASWPKNITLAQREYFEHLIKTK